MDEQLQIRIEGDSELPTLVYLPGLHGDCTLVTAFKAAIKGRVRFVGITYPRTLTWDLSDYAASVHEALVQHDIRHVWLMAESFGSQIAWPLLSHALLNEAAKVEGIILAGGFVKHPNPLAVWFARNFPQPRWLIRAMLTVYRWYATFRHRHAPETLASIDEFVARRTDLDRQAMKHRLKLVATNDPCSLVRTVSVPVYALSGFWDPIVPRVLTRRWLERNCPGYREAKVIYSADHNVLGTEPQKSADVVCRWIAKSV